MENKFKVSIVFDYEGEKIEGEYMYRGIRLYRALAKLSTEEREVLGL